MPLFRIWTLLMDIQRILSSRDARFLIGGYLRLPML